jgi:hypothetical protein
MARKISAPATNPVMSREQALALAKALGIDVALATAAEPTATLPTVKVIPPVAPKAQEWPSFLISPTEAAQKHGVTVTQRGNDYIVVISPGNVKVSPGRSKSDKSVHLAKPGTIALSEDGKLRLTVDLVLFDRD